jgi:hypothetical protein
MFLVAKKMVDESTQTSDPVIKQDIVRKPHPSAESKPVVKKVKKQDKKTRVPQQVASVATFWVPIDEAAQDPTFRDPRPTSRRIKRKSVEKLTQDEQKFVERPKSKVQVKKEPRKPKASFKIQEPEASPSISQMARSFLESDFISCLDCQQVYLELEREHELV